MSQSVATGQIVQHWIGGAEVESASERTGPVWNPATGQQIAEVNLASVAGRNGGGPGVSHYAAAKAGLIAFSKNIARELAPHGVRVNCVSPGFIDTPFHEQFSTPEIKKALLASIPMGRAGTSAEVAEVVAFLCSDASSYVCGETIEINGALLML